MQRFPRVSSISPACVVDIGAPMPTDTRGRACMGADRGAGGVGPACVRVGVRGRRGAAGVGGAGERTFCLPLSYPAQPLLRAYEYLLLAMVVRVCVCG